MIKIVVMNLKEAKHLFVLFGSTTYIYIFSDKCKEAMSLTVSQQITKG